MATLWVPKTVVAIENEKIKDYLIGEESNEIDAFVSEFFDDSQSTEFKLDAKFKARLTKEEYLNQVNDLKNEIQQGDYLRSQLLPGILSLKTLRFQASEFRCLLQIESPDASALFMLLRHWATSTLFSGSPERYT